MVQQVREKFPDFSEGDILGYLQYRCDPREREVISSAIAVGSYVRLIDFVSLNLRLEDLLGSVTRVRRRRSCCSSCVRLTLNQKPTPTHPFLGG